MVDVGHKDHFEKYDAYYERLKNIIEEEEKYNYEVRTITNFCDNYLVKSGDEVYLINLLGMKFVLKLRNILGQPIYIKNIQWSEGDYLGFRIVDGANNTKYFYTVCCSKETGIMVNREKPKKYIIE